MSQYAKPSRIIALGAACLFISFAAESQAETIITIQPHTSGNGYVVTYSWKGTFATGMDTGSTGNAFIDDNTTSVSSNYVMPSGNHTGGLILYSQHNSDGINGNYAQVPELGANSVHFDGTSGESLTPGEWMQESSHANVGFIENGGDWYNNPNDYGGVRFFGTGIQGAISLTSWNGIDSSSAYGDVLFEGEPLLGQGMQFGVNGGNAGPGANDSARFGMVGDAKYWRDLDALGQNNGLLIGYFPYASTFPNTATPTDKFTDQFNVGTYTSGDITMYIVNDSSYVPLLVAEDLNNYSSWSGGSAPGDDDNGDGVTNAVAYALGAVDTNEDVLDRLPTSDSSDPDDFVFTFNRSDVADADTSTTILVQYTTDLSVDWTPAVDGTDGVTVDDSTVPEAGFRTVVVTIPKSLAVDGKLFARLNVVVVTP